MNQFVYFLLFFILFSITGCAPANKDIPDSNDINVFVNNIVGTVTDTSSTYSISMATVDSLPNDTLISLGLDDVTQDQILFSVYQTAVGTFPIDLLPIGTAQGSLLFRKRISSSYVNYLMTDGDIVISVVDTVARRIKGTFDVNNIGAGAGNEFTIQADFNVKYNP
jgi:hypothetical protein